MKKSDSAPTVTAPAFRQVVGHLASGVTVVSTVDDGTAYGMTASSVTSLSTDPPMMLACLNNSAPTARAVSRAGRYAVNVLHSKHGDIAQQFAVPSADKFAGVTVREGVLGLPLIADALAHIECVVSEEVVGGTHTIFLGRVVSAEAQAGEPLTYYRGGFGRFEFVKDDQVYRRARDRVLQRVYQPDDVVEVEHLAEALEVDASAAFYALTRLASDGLVRRDPDRGYVITPYDIRTSDSTFDARLAIELGVIDLVVGAGPLDLDAMRAHFRTMAGLVVDDRFVDFEAYLDANYGFHQSFVSLAGNGLLTATFGALSIKAVMTRSFGATDETSQRFIDLQGAILDAVEAGDRARAREAATAYSAMAKQRAREVLAASGGRY